MRRRPPAPLRALAPGALAGLAIAAGCGGAESPPAVCTSATAEDVRRALAPAPRNVRLADGTLLSACVDHAESDAQLQTLGMTFVAVADELAGAVAERRGAAFRLGFLIGAAERGAGPTGGTQAELVQRLKQVVSFQEGLARRRRELMRGIAAGRRSG